MNYSEWESLLVKELKGLPTAEYMKITSYYREMYGDKLDAGMQEEDILREFGSPKACAEKILADSAEENAKAGETDGSVEQGRFKPSVKGIILGVLFTLFFGLPLAAIMVAVVVSLGAVCVGGGAGVIAGFAYSFIAPFNASGAGIAAHIGMAIATIGVGGFLAIGGFFATKYTAIYSVKLMKIIYRGILK